LRETGWNKKRGHQDGGPQKKYKSHFVDSCTELRTFT
jgi:hypothetical protein